MGVCFRCKNETDNDEEAHVKLGVYLCDECYMDDIDFCKDPYCTRQAIRPFGVCGQKHTNPKDEEISRLNEEIHNLKKEITFLKDEMSKHKK
jgi:hypothetical protein